MTTERIDPLAVIARCIEHLDGWSAAPKSAGKLAEAYSAVAELVEAADNALGVLIGSAIPAGGVDDRAAITDAQRQLRAALAAFGRQG